MGTTEDELEPYLVGVRDNIAKSGGKVRNSCPTCAFPACVVFCSVPLSTLICVHLLLFTGVAQLAPLSAITDMLVFTPASTYAALPCLPCLCSNPSTSGQITRQA